MWDADGASAWTGEMGQKQTLTLQHGSQVHHLFVEELSGSVLMIGEEASSSGTAAEVAAVPIFVGGSYRELGCCVVGCQKKTRYVFKSRICGDL